SAPERTEPDFGQSIPAGYGIIPNEWEEEDYPETEELEVGQARRIKVPIHSFSNNLYLLYLFARMTDRGKRKAASPPPVTVSSGSSVEELPPPPTSQAKRPRLDSLMDQATIAQQAFGFRRYLKAQVQNPNVAARLETNRQGKAAVSAASLASNSKARSKGKEKEPAVKAVKEAAPKADPAEFRVMKVFILPYGVQLKQGISRSPGDLPYEIRDSRKCTLKLELSSLSSRGYAASAKDDGFVFRDDWTKEQVWDKFEEILLEACALMLKYYDGNKHVNIWLPCEMTPHVRQFFVSPTMPPFSGARMSDIGGVGLKPKKRIVDCLCFISTATLPMNAYREDDDDNMFVINAEGSFKDDDYKPPHDNQPKAGPSTSTYEHRLRSSTITKSTNQRQLKASRSLSTSDEEHTTSLSDSGSESTYEKTESAHSRDASPAGDLNQSFSSIAIDLTRDVSDHECDSEVPELAVYRSQSPAARA
ncbi:hypothetical protein CVT24_007602, partial [Panaeolus cyanescens]